MEKDSRKHASAFLPFTACPLSAPRVTDAQNEHVTDLLKSPITNATEVTILVPVLARGAFTLRKATLKQPEA